MQVPPVPGGSWMAPPLLKSGSSNSRKAVVMTAVSRTFVSELHSCLGAEVILRGWVYRLRVLAKTTFVILKDCSGEAQCVATTESLHGLHLKLDDAIEVRGCVRQDERAKQGAEIDVL